MGLIEVARFATTETAQPIGVASGGGRRDEPGSGERGRANVISLHHGVILSSFFRNTTGTIRFECRPYGQGNVEQPVAMAVHEHAPKVGACYDSANRDAHPVIVMLENELCDRLTVRAAILTAATEAPSGFDSDDSRCWGGIAASLPRFAGPVTCARHTLRSRVLVVIQPVVGDLFREIVVVEVRPNPGRAAWYAEMRVNHVGVNCA